MSLGDRKTLQKNDKNMNRGTAKITKKKKNAYSCVKGKTRKEKTAKYNCIRAPVRAKHFCKHPLLEICDVTEGTDSCLQSKSDTLN